MSDFKSFEGKNNILLIAPHGFPEDDSYTAEISLLLQEKLNCSVIVNQKFKRTKFDKTNKQWPEGREPIDLKFPKVDLNFIPQVKEAKLTGAWLGRIVELKNKILRDHKICFVFLIHGAKDKSVAAVDPKADILVGIGLVSDEIDEEKRCTVSEETLAKILPAFNQKAAFARVGTYKQGNKYAAWDKRNLNQLFSSKNIDYNDPAVQSIQLEIKETGFRDKDKLDKTAETLSSALREIVGLKEEDKTEELPPKLSEKADVPAPEQVNSPNSVISISADAKDQPSDKKELVVIPQKVPLPIEVRPDEALVEEAYNFVVDAFLVGAHSTLLKIGEHIIEKFFDGNIELARNKDERDKNTSYSRLIEIIESRNEIPFRRSSLFNAVNLVIQKHDFASVQALGRLTPTQQILLLPIHNAARKQRLAEEAVAKDYTTRQLAEAIKNSNPESKETLISFIKRPEELFTDENKNFYSKESLKALTPKERKTVKERISKETEKIHSQIAKHQYHLEQYHALLEKIPEIVEEKEIPEKPKKKRSKFNDWVCETVSCQTGCSNDCLYCFAKGDAINKGRIVAIEDWPKEKLSKAGVKEKYKLFDKPVMCPGTHDITEENFNNTSTMLLRLLEAGNRVLIVSKPRPKIIEKLYVHLEKYRDKILFRFTIGAMDDNILAFWEPNAPTYNDRKEALRYAFEKGFRTSISIEPMLDPEKVTYLVNDLAPFVNHSIWIGTMNTTWYMDTDPSVAKTDAGKERANNNLKYYGEEKAEQIRNEIFRIRTLQGAVTLRKIYENLKDNPLVQWKWHIKDALGLPLPTESEKWPEEPIEQVKELALEK